MAVCYWPNTTSTFTGLLVCFRAVCACLILCTGKCVCKLESKRDSARERAMACACLFVYVRGRESE